MITSTNILVLNQKISIRNNLAIPNSFSICNWCDRIYRTFQFLSQWQSFWFSCHMSLVHKTIFRMRITLWTFPEMLIGTAHVCLRNVNRNRGFRHFEWFCSDVNISSHITETQNDTSKLLLKMPFWRTT